jgi:hypothetical protein
MIYKSDIFNNYPVLKEKIYKLYLLKLVFNGLISLNYWWKYKSNHISWIYLQRNISMETERTYIEPDDFELIDINTYKLDDGRIFKQYSKNAIWLYENNEFIPCELKENELQPLEYEPFIVNLYKSEIELLKKLAEKKHITLPQLIQIALNNLHQSKDFQTIS